jgi:hypothetical protein
VTRCPSTTHSIDHRRQCGGSSSISTARRVSDNKFMASSELKRCPFCNTPPSAHFVPQDSVLSSASFWRAFSSCS